MIMLNFEDFILKIGMNKVMWWLSEQEQGPQGQVRIEVRPANKSANSLLCG